MASQQAAPTATKSNDLSFARVVLSFRKWWRDDVMGTVDQPAVIEKRRAECVMSGRYMFMTAMSGGIAVLGLLLSSPAVVIGAMLLSPLMDPIMGLGFALAIGDYKWLRKSAKSLAWGSLMAIGLCALIVFLSPIQDITSEIASRTRPNLFDLLVAVFSALAGAYAMIRGREGTIVGVAIATALMPPLAVVGFGLATGNWTVFWGASLLYITNLMAIALIAALMARIYGFRTRLSDKQTQFQNFAIIAVFIALAVPLGFSLRQIAWEANSARQVRAELIANFGSSARLSQPEINFDGDPIQVSAFVWTTELKPEAEIKAEESLARAIGQKVDIDLKQFLVRDEKSAEQAQIISAQEQEEAAASQRADALADRLALMAGVENDEVIIDRQRRRAMVRAVELEGAPLVTYYNLERRIAATEPEWRVELIPPAKPLPTIEFADGELSEAGTKALALIAWSAGRVGAPVILSGPDAAVEVAQKELAEQGLPLVATQRGRGPNVTAEWGSIGQ
ncbi:TIGR00341 family protein [Pontixanthobacter aquaemixtae]|uniref:TIGR00341 family protein n=1 Tax=Pontixanthobacter aquaemixtae TaxID=1958940 RepID=A0A844ZQE9_9SPHN|nr:TIGR00341 family protein [Pontixanthobacter aquaemixtae]MXO89300.1 TIGR00341 family protein [Pontixanthobacter aquaemixtae]